MHGKKRNRGWDGSPVGTESDEIQIPIKQLQKEMQSYPVERDFWAWVCISLVSGRGRKE